MTPISCVNFIVVDVETTGAILKIDKITDIACVTVHNYQIVDTYSSLINPNMHIPHNIQRLTKITDAMVRSAPDSKDVMLRVRDILENPYSYFVAHNVDFDWNFINAAFCYENIHFNYNLSPICSLKLARKVIPSNVKKNVGSLAEYFNIPVLNRHRAYDDAFATANFFIEILYILQDKYDINTIEDLIEFQNSSTSNKIKIDNSIKIKLDAYSDIIPSTNGVMKFIDKNGIVLFVNYTDNMKQYISDILTNFAEQSRKIRTIFKNMALIDWIESNNELEGQITKLRQIKAVNPKFNNVDLITIVNENNSDKSLQNKSFVVLFPNSQREKLVDIYFIHNGKYCDTITTGTRSNTGNIIDKIHIYFKANDDGNNYDNEEIHIINNWITKNQQIIQLYNYYDNNEIVFINDIEIAIRNFYNN